MNRGFICFQDWLATQVDALRGPEHTAAAAVLDERCPEVRRSFGMVLDYLEDGGVDPLYISIVIWLYKRYCLYMAPELAGLKLSTRTMWKTDFNQSVIVRAGFYEDYKPLVVEFDPVTRIPREVKV